MRRRVSESASSCLHARALRPDSVVHHAVRGTATATRQSRVMSEARRASSHPSVRAGRIGNTIINAGKLDNYGTAKAQGYLKKWAKEYGEKN